MGALDGLVRLEARYECHGAPASMVFRFRSSSGSAPTPSDCQAVADAYGLWENNGAFGGSYTHRGSDSYFNRANVFSEDPRSDAVFIDTVFSRQGGLPFITPPSMPRNVAPIVSWWTDELGQTSGRTYAVGINGAALSDESDASTLTVADRVIVQSDYNAIRGRVLADAGYIQVFRSNAARAGLGPGPHVFDITGCGVYLLVGTQRRRLRHGRG